MQRISSTPFHSAKFNQQLTRSLKRGRNAQQFRSRLEYFKNKTLQRLSYSLCFIYNLDESTFKPRLLLHWGVQTPFELRKRVLMKRERLCLALSTEATTALNSLKLVEHPGWCWLYLNFRLLTVKLNLVLGLVGLYMTNTIKHLNYKGQTHTILQLLRVVYLLYCHSLRKISMKCSNSVTLLSHSAFTDA